MKHIAIIMPKLGGGGAERVITTIIRHIDKEKFKVTLILVHEDGEYQKDIPDNIRIKILSANKVRYAGLELINIIRSLKPDIVFSSIRGTSFLIGSIKRFFPKKTKVVIRENNSPSVSIKSNKNSVLWKGIYNTVFKRFDKIICQSEFMKKDFIENFSFKEDKLKRIYNPVDTKLVKEMSLMGENPFEHEGKKKNVVLVGKLTAQKGIDLIINSIFNNPDQTKNIKLWIIGDGTLRDNYQKLVVEKELTSKVIFVGRVNNPFIWISNADLLVLPSRYEGLPNVVLEALSLKTPIVTTDHPGGTNEVLSILRLEHRVVHNLDWSQSWFDDTYDSSFSIKDLFSEKVIIKQYEELFNSM
ncbi:glycosyltransferase [Shouchella sp. 1P09AA]|uniref:glycosyltransferase n=1 Tax=unclassified Shouchella TaxID=2893065 RepID=UPI00399FF74C